MIAQRFTLICLVTTILAMAFIALIDNSTRPAYSLIIDDSLPCIFDTQMRCAQ